jgi:hypothetical protein
MHVARCDESALAVRGRVAFTHVGEDAARADEEASVLALEHGYLIGAGEILEPMPLARPRLDLPRDEVEPELRQDLAHR